MFKTQCLWSLPHRPGIKDEPPVSSHHDSAVTNPREVEPEVNALSLVWAFAAAAAFVALSRWPVLRPAPFDTDEFGYLEMIRQYALPMHHTLFLAIARTIGDAIGNPYRGFLVLDMVMSSLALTALWWWLRAVVRPTLAVAATAVLAVAPLFWSYGAMAGNYTAIPLVGSILLGIAVRTWEQPRAWHPFAAAVVLAFGAGYRQDIGTFWLPVFALILWPHRWVRAVGALVLFTTLNLAWLVPMLSEVGLTHYREASGEFAHQAGYLNSVRNLGLVDAPLRYSLKLGMALVWTFGPRPPLRAARAFPGRFGSAR